MRETKTNDKDSLLKLKRAFLLITPAITGKSNPIIQQPHQLISMEVSSAFNLFFLTWNEER